MVWPRFKICIPVLMRERESVEVPANSGGTSHEGIVH